MMANSRRRIQQWLTAAVVTLACATSGRTLAEGYYSLIWTHRLNDFPEWCDAFKKAGFNSLVVPIPRMSGEEKWWLLADGLEPSNPLLDKAAETQFRAYYQLPIGMGPGTKIGPRLVTAAGFKEPLLACPLSDEFWDNYLIPSITAIARKSLDRPALKGVILDTEQYYGKERSGALNNNYCFCDECFQGFLNSLNLRDALPDPQSRQPWLVSHGRMDDYWRYLERRMESKTGKLSEAVKAISPSFEIHFYIYENTWYYRGLLKGLINLGRPVLICDGTTYDGFLVKKAQEVKSEVKRLNSMAIWAPGFYTESLNPRTMGINVGKATEGRGSYWIYNRIVPFPFEYLDKLPKPDR